jgi:NAD(P)H-flavin reductase
VIAPAASTLDPPDPLLAPRIHEVLDVVAEIPDVVTLRAAPVDGAPPRFLPAQVSMVGAFGIGEAAISISSSVTETSFHDYTIRRAGAITGALTALRPGDQFWTRGPFGSVWDLELDGRDVVIVAGGLGLAPLRSAVYAVLDRRATLGRARLIVGARSSRHLLYARQYDEWRGRGLEVVATVDRPESSWNGAVGFAPQVVSELDLDAGNTSALICGPDVMMRLTADTLVDRGVAAEHIQLTLERNMQCGVGLCGHCQLGPVIVCRDGPVVRYPAVRAALRVQEL